MFLYFGILPSHYLQLAGDSFLLSANHEDIEVKLQKLRDDYAARLPAQLDELLVFARQALKPGQQLQALSEVSQRLHKLAGSAGSFGFVVLGKQVKQLEQQVSQWLAAGAAVDPGQLQVFIVALGALASVAEANTPLMAPAVPTR